MTDPHKPMRLRWEDSHVRRITEERDAALAACHALVAAYQGGEPGESIDWSDIDDAVALAQEALSLTSKEADNVTQDS